mgnify:CR=1 FL=1
MNFIAIKMLMGDRAKYLGIIMGLTFASLLVTQQLAIFFGLMTRTYGTITDLSRPDVWVMDPSNPSSRRMVMQATGGGWYVADWSPDDRTILVLEYESINRSHLWLVDAATGVVVAQGPGTAKVRVRRVYPSEREIAAIMPRGRAAVMMASAEPARPQGIPSDRRRRRRVPAGLFIGPNRRHVLQGRRTSITLAITVTATSPGGRT